MEKITHRVSFKLFSSGNTKVDKGSKRGYISMVLMLSPAWRSHIPIGADKFRNVCPFASPGCRRACLNTAGQGGFGVAVGRGIDPESIENRVQATRRARTEMFYRDRSGFFRLMIEDIERLVKFAAGHMIDHIEKPGKRGQVTYFRPSRKSESGMKPCIRMNGTSDLTYEGFPIMIGGQRWPNIMTLFPRMQFYDYTKWPRRFNAPRNYYLNYSWSEFAAHPANRSDTVANRARDYLNHGMNVVAVFERFPEKFLGVPVIDGMTTDLRFLDPRPRVVGLYPLKFATEDDTGFVIKPGAPSLRLRNPARIIPREKFYDDTLGLFPDE